MEQRRSTGQHRPGGPTRRQAIGLAGTSIAAAAVLGGCGSSSGGSGSGSSGELTVPVTHEAESVEGLILSDVEGVAPLYVGSPTEYRDVVTDKPAAGGSMLRKYFSSSQESSSSIPYGDYLIDTADYRGSFTIVLIRHAAAPAVGSATGGYSQKVGNGAEDYLYSGAIGVAFEDFVS